MTSLLNSFVSELITSVVVEFIIFNHDIIIGFLCKIISDLLSRIIIGSRSLEWLPFKSMVTLVLLV